MRPSPQATFGVAAIFFAVTACRDLSGFSTTNGEHYEGSVVSADVVLAGMAPDTKLCLTFDADHVQDTPGVLSTSDGMFEKTPMRPIPQIWHDPLSTLSFGEGRVKNFVYVAASSAGGDVFVVVSLMQSEGVEVRLLRGAPDLLRDGGGPANSAGNLFAGFGLARHRVPCSF